jgi:hypothetical protein
VTVISRVDVVMGDDVSAGSLVGADVAVVDDIRGDFSDFIACAVFVRVKDPESLVDVGVLLSTAGVEKIPVWTAVTATNNPSATTPKNTSRVVGLFPRTPG